MTAQRPDPWAWRRLLRDQISLTHRTLEVSLADAVGCLLAAEVHSPEDIPALSISAMDGFAVRRSELIAPGDTPLPVCGDHPARPGGAARLPAGHALRIMTGAPVPHGADAVIPVEDTDADPFGPLPARVTIHLDAEVPQLRHIRTPGEEVARGELLAEPGDRVGAGLVGLISSLGLTSLQVAAPLQIAVIVTGDELTDAPAPDARAAAVTAAATAADGTVRESNGTMLAAALAAEGAETRVLRSSDDPGQLLRVLDDAGDSDLVITTGGIGHGAYDVVKAALGPRGRDTSRFEHLALRPGGPQGWGHLPSGAPVIHLPGTPVGALVGYHLFVRPLLPGTRAAPRRVLLGAIEAVGARRHRRPGLDAQAGRLRLGDDGRETVDLLPGRRLAPFGQADAIVLRETPEGQDQGAAAPAPPSGENTVLVIAL